MPGARVRASEGRMRKYLATIFGVAVGITAAILVAAHADEDQAVSRPVPRGQEGGA